MQNHSLTASLPMRSLGVGDLRRGIEDTEVNAPALTCSGDLRGWT